MPLQPSGSDLHYDTPDAPKPKKRKKRDWASMLGGYVAKKGPSPQEPARDENGRFTSGPGMAAASSVHHLGGGEHATPFARASDVRQVKGKGGPTQRAGKDAHALEDIPTADDADVTALDDIPMAHAGDVKRIQPPRLPSQRHNAPARQGPPGVAARLKAQDMARRFKVQKGSLLDGIAAVWSQILKQAQDAPEDDEDALAADVAEPVAKAATVDPGYLETQSLVAVTDNYVLEGYPADYALMCAEQRVQKHRDDTEARRKFTLWPEGPDGLDLQLGRDAYEQRAPGYISLDTYPHDHGTAVHDLSLGIPFPDACARSVLVGKDLGELSEDPQGLVADIARVLAPGGALLVGPHSGTAEVQEAIAKALGDDFEALPDAMPGWSLFGSAHVLQQILKSHPDHLLPILKAAAHEQVVYCVVLEPETFDAHDDLMKPEEIRKTAHKYLAKSRVVGSGHNRSIDGHPVESFLAPQDLTYEGGPFGKQVVKKGSWVVGLKIEDRAEWDKVLSGEYTGVSIGGFGQRRDIAGLAS